ncbi:MAG: MBL fold metallo-hydrolase [Pyrinomonadaceae bacterium]
MKFTVLGSGTAVPHPKRSSAAYWVETSGGTVLLDFSVFALGRMMAEGLDWWDLDAIWISHFHLDHCGGLPPFLFGSRYCEEMKDRKKPLRIFGGPGLKLLLQGFNDLKDYKLLDQPFPLEIIEIEPLEKFEIAPGLDAVALSTPHTDESHAIHLRDSDGSTLVYTSDTGFAETLAAFARKVGLLVIEASFPKDKPSENHLELSEAMYLIRKAEPGRAMLTHLYPEWDDLDFAAELRKFSPPCEVVQAYDGLAVEMA